MAPSAFKITFFILALLFHSEILLADGADMRLLSTDIGSESLIPKDYTGDGQDVSPPLQIISPPTNCKSFAVIMGDPDAQTAGSTASAVKTPWIHWVLYNIPANTRFIPSGIPRLAEVTSPMSLAQGLNSWNQVGYRGPAPPKGSPVHHYHFQLYALDVDPEIPAGLSSKVFFEDMKRHVIAKSELIATYQR